MVSRVATRSRRSARRRARQRPERRFAADQRVSKGVGQLAGQRGRSDRPGCERVHGGPPGHGQIALCSCPAEFMLSGRHGGTRPVREGRVPIDAVFAKGRPPGLAVVKNRTAPVNPAVRSGSLPCEHTAAKQSRPPEEPKAGPNLEEVPARAPSSPLPRCRRRRGHHCARRRRLRQLQQRGQFKQVGQLGPATASSAPATPTPTATIAKLTGVDTRVTLDAATAGVLKSNGVSVAPVGPATATMAGSNTVVAFPITGGHISLFDKSVQANSTPWIQGEIDHSGGLTFSAGGKEVTVTNFIVDPGKSLLTAAAGGAQVR